MISDGESLSRWPRQCSAPGGQWANKTTRWNKLRKSRMISGGCWERITMLPMTAVFGRYR